jgi:hypothetical protein
METHNPELQEKLQELEHELEVSYSVSKERRSVLGCVACPWDCVMTQVR